VVLVAASTAVVLVAASTAVLLFCGVLVAVV
jgi:hypothetical protein